MCGQVRTGISYTDTIRIYTVKWIENGIVIGLLVSDIESAIQELKSQNVTIYRDIESHKAGTNAIVLDPDKYMISLFEPAPPDSAKQARGFHGFAPL